MKLLVRLWFGSSQPRSQSIHGSFRTASLAFAAFLLGYILSQFFRSFLAVIAPELARDLAMSATDLGFASGAWFAAFAVSQFLVGWSLDAFGPRRTTAVLMVPAVLGSILFSIATTTPHVVAAMALIGVGCSPIYMSALYLFARALPADRFGLFASWMLAIGTSGNLLAATPLAAASAVIGWRASFICIAIVCAIAALIIAMIVRDPPRAIGSDLTDHILTDLKSIAGTRALWPLLPLVVVSYAIIAGERGLWIGPYLAQVYDLDAVARGNSALVMAAAMSAGAFIYGPLDRWIGRRKWIVGIGSLLTATGFLLLWHQPEIGPGAATAVLALIGAAGSTYAVLMAHGRQFIPEHLLGRGLTFLNFMFMAGIGLIQWMSGRFVDAALAAATPPPLVYAQLHLGFALALFAALAVYMTARER